MRVLYLGINYWPEETGIGAYAAGRCEYLASKGHEVVACTGFPYYPQWRIRDGYRGRIAARERRNGVAIRRSWLFVPSAATSMRRILHEASFTITCCVNAFASRKPEIIVAATPPLGLAVVALLLARVWKIPYLLLVEDLQPDAAVDLGMLKPGRLVDALFALERLVYRNAGLVSTLTEGMGRRIISKAIPEDKVAVIPHWVDPGLFAIPLQGGGRALRDQLGLAGKFLVLHSGNMGVKQGLGAILDAAERSRDHSDIVYLLVGDGSERESLEKRAATLGNVKFYPLLPKPIFHQLLGATDVALITQQRCVADILFPSKTETLLAAGRAVVASVNASSEVARVVTQAKAGVVTTAEDSSALLEAILSLRESPVNRSAMGASGRAYACEHWAPENSLNLLERKMRSVSDRISTLPPRRKESSRAHDSEARADA